MVHVPTPDQPSEPSAAPAPTGASETVRQAVDALRATVHDEVDCAHVGPTRVLTSADGQHVYAGAVVAGPLRTYVATVWGSAGRVASKHIVSYGNAAAAHTALDATLERQRQQGYEEAGTVDAEA